MKYEEFYYHIFKCELVMSSLFVYKFLIYFSLQFLNATRSFRVMLGEMDHFHRRIIPTTTRPRRSVATFSLVMGGSECKFYLRILVCFIPSRRVGLMLKQSRPVVRVGITIKPRMVLIPAESRRLCWPCIDM